jgi:hypothetical protein
MSIDNGKVKQIIGDPFVTKGRGFRDVLPRGVVKDKAKYRRACKAVARATRSKNRH